MSLWSRVMSWFGMRESGMEIEPGLGFVIDGGSIPAEIFGLETYASPILPVARVSRREAIQVPAVKRGRDLIAGTIGTVPFRLIDTENVEHVSSLLSQPEEHQARSISMTALVEDLLFEGQAWWWITQYDFRGYPTKVLKLDAPNFTDERGHMLIQLDNGRTIEIPPKDLIFFKSPTDAVLDAGARAIRTWLKLATAVDKYADEPVPSGYFTPKPEADPDEGDIDTFLDDWAAARKLRATAYVPAVVDYKTVQWNPEQLQLSEGRKQAVIEIAEVMGIDAEDLSVSTTSRTYQNGQQRKIDRINETLGMYVSAIQERLSMADVTPRGYRVLADFNGFLRADDKTRFETYQLGVALGIYDRDSIAAREGLPQPMFPEPQRALPAPIVSSGNNSPVEASNFEADPNFFGFDTPETRTTFAVDTEHRTIAGLAVPYGVAAKKNGQTFQFSKGSLAWSDPSRVKLLIQHDRSQAVGKALELDDRDDGLYVRLKIARTAEGDRALALAEDGVYDGLSVGLSNEATFDRRDGINHSKVGNLLAEISLTPSPAFDDARVSAVVAEADDERNHTMPPEATEATAAPATFDMEALVNAIAERLNPTSPSGSARQINEHPNGPLAAASSVEVTEASPYRFNSSGTLVKGSHEFSDDLRDAFQGRNQAAHDRALEFIQQNIQPRDDAPATFTKDDAPGMQFAITVANVAGLNPNIQAPQLYVDQRKFQYPLWDAVRKGTLTEITPIVVPKWSTASGLVAAHVQGTEPTPGAFTVTTETVTPAAVSGKVEINREVWDQGGPLATSLIWSKMVQAYNEALEAMVVTELEAESPGTTTTLTTAGADAALSGEIAAAWAGFQYTRGGFAYDTFALQIDLFKKLVAAKDGNNRPLFPILAPMNAPGSSAPRYAHMNIHGVDGFPAWALAATGSVAANSYLFDSSAIYAVASSPQRLEFSSLVKQVELGVWGYMVCEVIDNPGIVRVIYDPV